MLGSHPEVCAPQEIGLFAGYLSGWQAKWDEEIEESARAESRQRGLPAALTAAEFKSLLRRTAMEVYGPTLQAKPEASVLLDKEPTNTFHTALIAEVFPEARFIHLLRDGRDVAASLVAASKENWAKDWAPTRVSVAAGTWKEHVVAARATKDLGLPFLEARYEDLLAAPVESLVALFEFVGVAGDVEMAERVADEFSFARVRESGSRSRGITRSGELSSTSSTEPKGFYRRGVAGSWQSEWSDFDKAEFDRIAGQLLVELGYERRRVEPPLAVRVARFGSGVRDGAKDRVKARIRAFNYRHPSLRP